MSDKLTLPNSSMKTQGFKPFSLRNRMLGGVVFLMTAIWSILEPGNSLKAQAPGTTALKNLSGLRRKSLELVFIFVLVLGAGFL